MGPYLTERQRHCISSGHTPKIAHSRKRPSLSWKLNYPALVNGQYYVEYQEVFGITEYLVISDTA